MVSATTYGCTEFADRNLERSDNPKETGLTVKVVKEPVTYEKSHTNDRLGSDDAQTHWFFHCIPRPSYEVVEEVVRSKETQISIRITGGQLRVGLSINQVIARNDSARLREHEDGHAKICESVYAEAEAAATKAVRASVGHIFSGVGKDKAAASASAIKNAREYICTEFSARTAARASELSKQYDEITAHGRNAVPSRQALEQILGSRH
jgi:hypothetical protein